MATRLVVIGDSVPWGQGLLPENKFYNLVAARLGIAPQETAFLAHSGAIIGVGTGRAQAPFDGEVPVSYPTILQQCLSFTGDNSAVELVILNGGINDIDFRVIINPFTDSNDLRDDIEEHCYRGMMELLRQALATFQNPATKFVVTSYFPILSNQSSILLVPVLLTCFGIGLPTLGLPVKDLAFGRPVANCQQFWMESTDRLSRAVADTNAKLAKPRVFFAKPPFQDSNAALAPDPWLWGIDLDLSPQDEVIASRHDACTLFERDFIQRETCFRASAGHPNVRGARKFADAILALL